MPATLCASPSSLFIVLPERALSTHALRANSRPAIKVLDLLSNRYYLGRVRVSGEDSMEIELPMASRLHAGQRVRFVLADDSDPAIVSRMNMRSAVVQYAEPQDGALMRVELSLMPEMAAA